MRVIIAIALLVLSGCKPSEAEVLERNYRESVEKHGRSESCSEERNIAAAWAREGDQKKYNEAKLSADIQCLSEASGG